MASQTSPVVIMAALLVGGAASFVLFSGSGGGQAGDHRAAIVQVGPAEILVVAMVVAVVSALVCAVMMTTRMNPYVQDRVELRAAHEAIVTVSLNLKNLATFVGAAAILRENPEEAEEFGRRMDEVIQDMRGPGRTTARKDDHDDEPN